jgi:uncharacterized Ntn-hydrolase superfamily protein
MTWSIVARDAASGAFGVAVTTKAFAMGARCPHAMSGVGAIATQSFTNPMFGTRGLRLLQEGVAAADVVDILVAGDDGRAIRQLHLIDAQGRNAAYTGASCIAWCGHRLGDGVSVAGNMLVGPAVVNDTFDSYVAATAAGDKPYAERLIGALDAGQAAGGDKRGRQSAALLVYSSEDVADIDLRVDDHPETTIPSRCSSCAGCSASITAIPPPSAPSSRRAPAPRGSPIRARSRRSGRRAAGR